MNSNMEHAQMAAASSFSTSAGPNGGPPSPSSGKIADPEVLEKPKRRRFTAQYKLRVLRDLDAAKASGKPGAVGVVLRREGLYSSHLVDWRKEREAGELAGLTPAKRGPKPSKDTDPTAVELARLRRENARLENELRKASIIIDVQKKVALLLGNPIESPPEDESR